MTSWITLFGVMLTVTVGGCAQSPFERGGYPAGHSRYYYDVERDYRDCEIRARLANDQFFHKHSSPFPLDSGPMSPADPTPALHGMTTLHAMRDTCLAAKGYRLN